MKIFTLFITIFVLAIFSSNAVQAEPSGCQITSINRVRSYTYERAYINDEAQTEPDMVQPIGWMVNVLGVKVYLLPNGRWIHNSPDFIFTNCENLPELSTEIRLGFERNPNRIIEWTQCLVSANGVNIRGIPSTDKNVIVLDTLHGTAFATAKEYHEGYNWYIILTSKGAGWIRSDVVSVSGNCDSLPTSSNLHFRLNNEQYSPWTIKFTETVTVRSNNFLTTRQIEKISGLYNFVLSVGKPKHSPG
jgi:hypothetical protein